MWKHVQKGFWLKDQFKRPCDYSSLACLNEENFLLHLKYDVSRRNHLTVSTFIWIQSLLWAVETIVKGQKKIKSLFILGIYKELHYGVLEQKMILNVNSQCLITYPCRSPVVNIYKKWRFAAQIVRGHATISQLELMLYTKAYFFVRDLW